MRTIFFTPGPSELYPTVPAHFRNGLKKNIGSISHRSKAFQEIYQELSESLKKLLGIPSEYHTFVVGSGTEAMERTIQNCVENYSFHLVNGSFSKRFFTTAQELGKNPQKIEVPLGQGFDFSKIAVQKKTELICFTHNETSTGVMIPATQITNIAKKYPKILVSVDTVSSAPYVNLDYRLVDVVFFSVQKLFGLPAGLGIMIVSPRAMKKAKSLEKKRISIGSYHNFATLLQFAQKQQTPETPPVLEMYVLGKVIEDMIKVGINNLRNETERKAEMLYEFLDSCNSLSAFVKEQQFRSMTTIVVDIHKGKKDVKKLLAERGCIVLGGYGPNKDTQIRIANYPAHSVQDIKYLIKQLRTI